MMENSLTQPEMPDPSSHYSITINNYSAVTTTYITSFMQICLIFSIAYYIHDHMQQLANVHVCHS